MKIEKLKLNNFHYFLTFLFLLSCLLARSSSDMMAFVETQYVFNYQFEFLKRGLLGELLRLSFDKVNSQIIYNISGFFLIILSVFFFKIFFLDFNKEKNIHKLIFSVMAFTSPLTLQHFIHDIGRQDIVNLLITFLSFFLIERFHKNYFLLFFTILLSISTMLLIHEGSFFMFVPMIFGFWFLKNSNKNSVIIQLILIFIIVFITFYISNYGLSTKFTFIELNSYLLNRYFIPYDIDQIVFIQKSALDVLFRDLFNTYDPHVQYAIIEDAIVNGFTIESLISNLILILLLSPIFFIVYKIYFNIFKSSNLKTKIFLLLPLSPFVLFLFGFDHMRWWALIFTNIFIAIFYLCKEKKDYQRIILNNVKEYKFLYFLLIFEAFLLGPVRVIGTFDIVQKFIF